MSHGQLNVMKLELKTLLEYMLMCQWQINGTEGQSKNGKGNTVVIINKKYL